MCVCVCVCVSVRACVRACVCVCVASGRSAATDSTATERDGQIALGQR